MSNHVALYGAVNMVRERCTACDCYALVLDGKLLCCGARHRRRP